jgi:NAD(P)-dependent dehydrogenase (short-subunit alcohol dehydrogenase family)
MTGPFSTVPAASRSSPAPIAVSAWAWPFGLVAVEAKIAVVGRGPREDKGRPRERRAGGEAMAIEVDVVLEDDCLRLIRKGGASFGRLDILLNYSGNEPKPPETFALAEWNGC